jgi:hypothetical protein
MNYIEVDVPEGKRGPWSIERFTVSDEESKLHRMMNLFSGDFRYCPPGHYTRLVHTNYGVVMSNTPDECRDHHPILWQASGRVLINGLGLGVVLQGMLDREREKNCRLIEQVTVIEIDYDVIALVAAHYQAKFGQRLKVINDDALTYRPARGSCFDAVWHDIWPEICADNLEQMKVLHRRYGRLTKWQGSWCRELCEKQRRQERAWY